MIDEKLMTSVFFAEATATGIADAKAVTNLIVDNDNPVFAYVATLGKMRFLEMILGQTLSQEMGSLTLADAAVIKEKANLTAALFLITSGSIKAKDAAVLFAVGEEYVPLLQQAEERGSGKSSAGMAQVMEDLSRYLFKK